MEVPKQTMSSSTHTQHVDVLPTANAEDLQVERVEGAKFLTRARVFVPTTFLPQLKDAEKWRRLDKHYTYLDTPSNSLAADHGLWISRRSEVSVTGFEDGYPTLRVTEHYVVKYNVVMEERRMTCEERSFSTRSDCLKFIEGMCGENIVADLKPTIQLRVARFKSKTRKGLDVDVIFWSSGYYVVATMTLTDNTNLDVQRACDEWRNIVEGTAQPEELAPSKLSVALSITEPEMFNRSFKTEKGETVHRIRQAAKKRVFRPSYSEKGESEDIQMLAELATQGVGRY